MRDKLIARGRPISGQSDRAFWDKLIVDNCRCSQGFAQASRDKLIVADSVCRPGEAPVRAIAWAWQTDRRYRTDRLSM